MKPDNQFELFPDKINEEPSRKAKIEFASRGEVRGYNNKQPYELAETPQWVLENRNRDTSCNLEDTLCTNCIDWNY